MGTGLAGIGVRRSTRGCRSPEDSWSFPFLSEKVSDYRRSVVAHLRIVDQGKDQAKGGLDLTTKFLNFDLYGMEFEEEDLLLFIGLAENEFDVAVVANRITR